MYRTRPSRCQLMPDLSQRSQGGTNPQPPVLPTNNPSKKLDNSTPEIAGRTGEPGVHEVPSSPRGSNKLRELGPTHVAMHIITSAASKPTPVQLSSQGHPGQGVADSPPRGAIASIQADLPINDLPSLPLGSLPVLEMKGQALGKIIDGKLRRHPELPTEDPPRPGSEPHCDATVWCPWHLQVSSHRNSRQ